MTLRNKLFASPVNRLVICAARPYPDDEAKGALRDLVREDVDWDAVLQTAREAKVLPLVSRNLCEAAGDLLPTDVAERLRRAFEDHVRRNLQLAAELVRLVRRLAEHGIEALPFKGPVLAQTLYDNLALRQFSDLDLGFVDAAVIATAEALGLTRIATTDRRHFEPVARAVGLLLVP